MPAAGGIGKRWQPTTMTPSLEPRDGAAVSATYHESAGAGAPASGDHTIKPVVLTSALRMPADLVLPGPMSATTTLATWARAPTTRSFHRHNTMVSRNRWDLLTFGPAIIVHLFRVAEPAGRTSGARCAATPARQSMLVSARATIDPSLCF